jgi:hypothetical protein
LSPRLGQHSSVVRRAVYAVAIVWLPLLLLTVFQGLAYNDQLQIPFLKDFAANSRFLVALPILILAEVGIDERLRNVVGHFLTSGLVKADSAASFDTVIESIERLRDWVLADVVLIVLSYIPSLMPSESEFFLTGVTSWHSAGTGLSYAGWWFLMVSVPIFRFLLLRWVWRIVLWGLFIWRATHIKLHLVATHTDLAGGLGFLAEAQGRFSPIVFAGGVVISGAVGNAMAYEGATINSVRFVLLTYVVLALLALVAPLVLAAPTLIRLRKRARLQYGALLTAHDQAFHAKWFHSQRKSGEELLGNPDASSLAHLGRSFEVVRDMRPIPLDRRMFISLAVSAALPMLPVILIATPADEIIKTVLKMLA